MNTNDTFRVLSAGFVALGLSSCVVHMHQAKSSGHSEANAVPVQSEPELDTANCDSQQMHAWAKKRNLPAPVNLARTSLASVTASSVNGNRGLADPYCGVLNAFDDSRQWSRGINYTTWTTSNEPVPWIEVYFDNPVIVTAVVVEAGPNFSLRVHTSDGEFDFRTCKELFIAEEPIDAVTSLRLNFQRKGKEDWGPLSVAEVRLLGYPPQGVDWKSTEPRIRGTGDDPEVRVQAQR